MGGDDRRLRTAEAATTAAEKRNYSGHLTTKVNVGFSSDACGKSLHMHVAAIGIASKVPDTAIPDKLSIKFLRTKLRITNAILLATENILRLNSTLTMHKVYPKYARHAMLPAS
jgi:hypothetical protein